MARKKVKLAFISNNSSRKATFKKRKKGLMKKVSELSTLCGVNACAIIYSPYDANPQVWPSNSGVQRVVSEFRALPEMDQQKHMVDQCSYLGQRITKTSEHMKRQMKEMREMEMTEVMSQSLSGNMGMFQMNLVDLNDFRYIIDQKLKEVNHRSSILRNSGMEVGESSNAGAVGGSSQEIGSMANVVSTAFPTTPISEMGTTSSFAAFYNPIQQQFHHPSSSHIGQQSLNTNLNLNLNHNQNQQLQFMKTMNHPEQWSHATEQMTFPFMDNLHHNNNHPLYQPHHQQQQIPGESSTVSAANSPSNIIPASNPNFTNNF